MTTSVLVVYGLASLGVLAACVLVRLAYGTNPQQLVRTRGYEIPPFRVLVHVLHVSLWALTIVSGLVGVRYLFAAVGGGGDYLPTVLAAVAFAALFGGVLFAVRRFLVFLPSNPPPFVCVTSVETQHGIDRDHLARLGEEQFPHCLVYGHTSGLKVRLGLAIAGFVAVAWLVVGATLWGQENGFEDAGLGLVKTFRVKATLKDAPPALAVIVLVSCTLMLALLLLENKTYTLLQFPYAAAATGVFALAAWLALGNCGASDLGLARAAAFIGLVCALRWTQDLRRARRFKRARQVSEPIAARVATVVPDLAPFKTRPDCKLPIPDEGDLSARITRGCRNVEEASPLVTRNLARFLALVKVEYEQFAAAMMRFLTVRRFVGTCGGGGTMRFLQHPVVPMWNETLFPLHPPTGFKNWLDPLPLGSEWDIVSICPTCGGSGRVRRTETWTETQNGQTVTRSREVEETCGQCGGTGRVVYQQILNTQWQRLMPTCTDPHVQVPEFMEDAEERTYYRVPMVENRESLRLAPRDDGKIGADLKAELWQAAQELAGELPDFAEAVEKLHDGILYRADFQVTAFWTTRINFRRLPGKVGWFFGARPEFHFPALPVSWGAVASVAFVVPFLALCLLTTAAGIQNWLGAVLPTIR